MKRVHCFVGFIVGGVIGIQSAFGIEAADTMKIVSLEEVNISSSRMNSPLKNLPQKVEIVTQEQIRSGSSESLAEVLKRTSSLDIVQYPGMAATIGMRGFSPTAHSRSYTLMLIDGKPMGTINLAAVIPSNVERIEIIKGPYSTLYGSDAMGGVVNVITKPLSEKFSGDVSLEGGSFAYYRAEAFVSGPITRSLRAGIGGTTVRQGDDYKIGRHNLLAMNDLEEQIMDRASYGDRMLHSTYDLSTLNAMLDWTVNDRWTATVQAMYTFANDVQLHGNYWGTYGQSKKEVNRINVYGSVERKSGNNTLSVQPYFTREKEPNYSDNSSNGFISFESNISEYGVQIQDRIRVKNVTLMGGVDLGVYDYYSERFEAKGTPTAPFKPNNKNSKAALFAQAAYHYGNLDVNAGARFDHLKYHIDANEALNAPESDATHNVVNPSVGAQYRVGHKLKAHASFGTAFSVPDAYKTAGKYDVSVYFPEWDYWWTQSYIGNPDLKPEKSRTADFGLKFTDNDRGIHADLTYFHTRHTDIIVEYVLNTGENSFKNANRSLMDGLELNASYNVGALFGNQFILELYANWTWLFHSDYTGTLAAVSGADSTVTHDLEFVRKMNGNFGVFFENQLGLSGRLNARYIGNRYERDNFTSIRPGIQTSDYATGGGYALPDMMLKNPDFLVLDLSVNYDFNEHFHLGCTVSNLLDENYAEKDGYHMFGRQIRFRVGYKF